MDQDVEVNELPPGEIPVRQDRQGRPFERKRLDAGRLERGQDPHELGAQVEVSPGDCSARIAQLLPERGCDVHIRQRGQGLMQKRPHAVLGCQVADLVPFDAIQTQARPRVRGGFAHRRPNQPVEHGRGGSRPNRLADHRRMPSSTASTVSAMSRNVAVRVSA